MKIGRNKIIFIVVILILLLVYVNRKNIRELFYDSFLDTNIQPSDSDHGYTMEPVVDNNWHKLFPTFNKYKIIKDFVKPLGEVSSDMIAFYHYHEKYLVENN